MATLQGHELDWGSLVAQDFIGLSQDQHGQDTWQDPWRYNTPALPSDELGCLDRERKSSTSSVDNESQRSFELNSPGMDWEDLFHQAWGDYENGLVSLDNDKDLGMDLEHWGRLGRPELFDPTIITEKSTSASDSHHHHQPYTNLDVAMEVTLGSQSTEHASSSATPEHTEPAVQKPKRTCKRKPREKPPQPPQVIEKRYRNNLNEKIAELKTIVPTLRARVEGIPSGEEFLLAGLQPARTLKKSVVLDKTIEYIRHLEDCNEALASQIVMP
ncbi:hypothetical protein PRZ48_004482 [Zasmidium cellare]|uniref:BHLH domain-containing protein n=1 Tax=Zasmidium cellare TaxID=395010 RepID=A0ABR0EPM8_ZASCE|nr:hypothetical protein PRZ48_004482 [Zasmidium cellare]